MTAAVVLPLKVFGTSRSVTEGCPSVPSTPLVPGGHCGSVSIKVFDASRGMMEAAVVPICISAFKLTEGIPCTCGIAQLLIARPAFGSFQLHPRIPVCCICFWETALEASQVQAKFANYYVIYIMLARTEYVHRI
jgi:hypothetical protein